MFNLGRATTREQLPQQKPVAMKNPAPTPAQDAVLIQAAVLVTEVWLSFADATAVYQWADTILKYGRPTMRLSPQAPVEAIVGHPALNRDTRDNMRELLLHLLDNNGLNRQAYQIDFIDIVIERLKMRVWVVTAVHRSQATLNINR